MLLAVARRHAQVTVLRRCDTGLSALASGIGTNSTLLSDARISTLPRPRNLHCVWDWPRPFSRPWQIAGGRFAGSGPVAQSVPGAFSAFALVLSLEALMAYRALLCWLQAEPASLQAGDTGAAFRKFLARAR